MRLMILCIAAVCAAACSSNAADAPPTFVCSPTGDVDPEAKAYSPGAKQFAKLIEPAGYGRIGIFDAASGDQLSVLEVTQHPDGEFPSPLKAMGWDSTGGQIAVLFHNRGSKLGGAGHVSIVNVESGQETALLPIQREGRCVRFAPDGKAIDVDGEVIAINQ